jgi:hypothetical protein
VTGAGCADVDEPSHGQRVRAPVHARVDSAEGSDDALWPEGEPLSPEAIQQADSSSQSVESDTSTAADCSGARGEVIADVVTIAVGTAHPGAPTKGDAIQLALTIENRGTGVAHARITPRLDSQRFSDYTGVPVGTKEVTLCPGTTKVVIEGGPFLTNPDNGKRYALGSGGYTVSSVQIEIDGQPTVSDRQYLGATFNVGTSNALLVPVVYDPRYLSQITGNTSTSPEAYLEAAFARPNEVFTPSGSDPDGAGTYQSFSRGFDQMMNVRHLFHAFPSTVSQPVGAGWCEGAADAAKIALNMASAWNTQPAETRPERHGFDYLLALTPDLAGGVACSWLDVQVSGLINRDYDRQQIVAVHETGHLFGAPHCDDVGDGAGGPLQGYVMCSGEKHPRYPAQFVWHATSRNQMKPHWD